VLRLKAQVDFLYHFTIKNRYYFDFFIENQIIIFIGWLFFFKLVKSNESFQNNSNAGREIEPLG
jgi:hypothetical protein